MNSDDQPKDYSATLIMLTVGGFIAATWFMEMFG